MPDPRYIAGASTPGIPASESPPMRWPSWMDAHYQITASHEAHRVIAHPGGNAAVLVEGNARRWALGFAAQSGGGTAFVVSPFDLGPTFGFFTSLNLTALHFTLFTHGPLVQMPWNVYAAGAGNFLCYEIILQ